MAAKLSFAEFDAKLKSGTLTAAEHRKYLEIDPDAETVRVRFKPGALRTAPPPGYDVDREVYLADRAGQEREIAALALTAKKLVVAEGDSWFNLPKYIRPEAIADRLESNKRVAIKNIARWGETLAQMLQAKEYLVEIPKSKPDWFIFSGGGNDLQESLARRELVHTYDAARPVDQCLTPKGISLLVEIAEGVRTLLNEIAIAHPTLPTICFAYDYPRPTFKGGKYIGKHLGKMAYPKTTWDAVARFLIDKLTATIEPVVKAFPNARFLDCRGVTSTYPFFDDMHPGTEGFKALAHVYEKAFGVVTVMTARPKAQTRKRATPAKSGKARSVRRGK